MSSGLSKPVTATLSGFSFAAFSTSAHVLNGPFSAAKKPDACWMTTPSGMKSDSLSLAFGRASSANVSPVITSIV